MKYTITLQKLVKRPIIRSDMSFEYLNKMTNEEINQFEEEVTEILIKENVPQKFPDFNAAHLAKFIDREILYSLFKLKITEKQK